MKKLVLSAGSVLALALLWQTPEVSANHPVLVEGERDFDGDGRLGAAEDDDNATDRIFGTLTAALGAANGGANQNGRITIVSSGRFPEALLITGAGGNVTIEAAPGVEANIDAVLAGNPGSVERQGFPGITVNAPNTRIITLRNLVVRNWTTGIAVSGASRVVIDHCRIENNLNYGVQVLDTAKATITHTLVTASGFRVGMAPGAAEPGTGIVFHDSAAGIVANTTVAGSAGVGIANENRARNPVLLGPVTLFDNNPDMRGMFRPVGGPGAGN